jgi:hypothetical protein
MLVVCVKNFEGAAPFTITALPVGEREMICPSIVSAPPGVSVWAPNTRSDEAFSVRVAEPTTKVGARVVPAPPD